MLSLEAAVVDAAAVQAVPAVSQRMKNKIVWASWHLTMIFCAIKPIFASIIVQMHTANSPENKMGTDFSGNRCRVFC